MKKNENFGERFYSEKGVMNTKEMEKNPYLRMKYEEIRQEKFKNYIFFGFLILLLIGIIFGFYVFSRLDAIDALSKIFLH